MLHRDGLILVIDKPAGLAVHAGPSGAPNLEECFDDLRFGLPRPPALAHRLDADTAGVLVLGRHPKALAKLGRLFSGRDTEKTYWAIVEGAPPADEGVFDWPLLKVNTKSGWSVKVSDKGQTAIIALQGAGPWPRHDLARAHARDRPHASAPRALRRTPAARSSATGSTARRRLASSSTCKATRSFCHYRKPSQRSGSRRRRRRTCWRP